MILLNLDRTHPGLKDLLKRNGFSVNRSGVPTSRNAIDITIEQTINRHAKSHGGIIGFSRNYAAYYRWCMTRHSRAQYLQATMEMVDMDNTDSSSHKDIRKSEIQHSEADVRMVVDAISNFLNPFEVENKDVLYCISPGAPALADVEEDLLSADMSGNKARDEFIKDRLVKKTTSFFDPVKKQRLKTFASLAKCVKLTGSEKKSRQMRTERTIFGQLVLLSLKHNISMEKTLCYLLGPVPWSLATSDGKPVKTDKSKLLHCLEGTSNVADRPSRQNSSYNIDGNALTQAQAGIPATFGELADVIFGQLPKTEHVDFVSDRYIPCSIKENERLLRGTSQAPLVKGPLTPRDWKGFLSNSTNKEQLINLLKKEWKKDTYAERLLGRKIFVVSEETCLLLTSSDGKHTEATDVVELRSSQEEADTRIVLHCKHMAAKLSPDSTIVVRSPDTDVFILLLKFGQDILNPLLFDTGVGNKRRLLDVHKIISEVGEDICGVLPALHAYSECDTTSAFVRKGKLAPLKTLLKHKDFIDVFLELGSSDDLKDTTFVKLEEFTCLLYKKRLASDDDIHKLRYNQFMKKFSPKQGMLLSCYDGVDLSLLPPCRSSLKMHIRKENYQCLILCKAEQATPDIPPPDGHGWYQENGKLGYQWTDGDLMPKELVDVLIEELPDKEDEENEENPEIVSYIDEIYDSEN